MSPCIHRTCLVAITAVTLAVAGCRAETGGHSKLSTTVGTRTVKASLHGSGFISSQGDSVTVTFEGGKLVVEKTRVLLNDKELTKIPAEATTVEIDYTNGTLNISADGKSEFKTSLEK